MANQKISDLTALTSMSDDDLLVVVDAPASTPVTKNITFANFKSTLVTLTGTETLTNKTLTSPKVNEDVAVTSTATEINVLDGIPATLTATELGYVDGVTSAIQTQMDLKAPLSSPTLVTPVLGVATATSINKVTITAPATSATLTIAQGSSLITAGAYAITLTATNTTGVTLPTTGTLATLAGTETLTNKAVTQRVVTTTDDATAIIDCTITDQYQLSAIANATEFTVTGTPTDGQKLIIRYKDAGVSKNLTFTGFTAIGVTIPTATTAGKWGYVGAIYNLATTTWHVLAVGTQA